MCQPTPCTVCGKTTWKGCGEHVDAVQAQVPADQWCPGHDVPQAPEPSHGLRRMFGR